MAHQRFDLRKQPDGQWSVIDVFTGWPVVVSGHTMENMAMDEADDLVDLLNWQDVNRRGTAKRR